MKIAYVARFDARDVRQWSGIGLHMTRALETAGASVEHVGPFSTPGLVLRRARRWYSRRVRGCVYDIVNEPSVARSYAAQARSMLQAGDAELILSSDVPSIAALEDERPLVLWTGATYAALSNYYESYTNLCERSLRHATEMERELLERCAAVIYASQWAADSAAEVYGIDRSKLFVVPFGANVDGGVGAASVDATVDRRLADGRCRLLFLGVDWRRKGGDIALAATARLRERGVDAVLTVVGCDPDGAEALPDWLRPLGYVSKDTPEGRATIARELSDSTLLLLPTRAENYGIVFCEAAAYGLPSLATVTGGVPTIVRDGVNGKLFELDEGPDSYADYVAALLGAPDRYREMCRAARAEFDARLNWDRAGSAALDVCRRAARQTNGVAGPSE